MTIIYVGTTEAASRLHLSPQRVRKLALEGRIKGAYKDCGATVWLELEPNIPLEMNCFA